MSNQKEKTTAQAAGMNRAKPYQLVLFPMNNGATNVYYILTMNFIAYYANGVLGLALMFATTMVTVMRLFDAVTDPIIGALIDRTNSKFGNRKCDHDRFFHFTVFWDEDHRTRHAVAALCMLCVILCIICYRIHIPDGLYPFRTDLSDKRSETAPDVYYF